MSFTEAFRPYSINDLIGQGLAKRLVTAWLANPADIPRSILVQGVYSSGKTSVARIIARSLLCAAPTAEGNACAKCESCKRFDDDSHPDYREIDAASERGINEMRVLTSNLKLLPLYGKRKVVVLDEAHQITAQGWQAMLKTLEEPPPHATVIIATTNPEKLPDTIQSRCSRVKLKELTPQECTDILARVAKDKGLGKYGITHANLEQIARATRFRPRNALHALDQVAAMAMESGDGPTAVMDGRIAGFVEQVTTTDVQRVAAAVIKLIIEGKPGGAMKCVLDTHPDSEALLVALMALSRQAMMLANSPKLLDPYFKDVFEGLAFFGYPEAKYPLLAVHEVFTTLRLSTANYAVPVADLIDGAICKAGLICQRYRLDQAAASATPQPAAQPIAKVAAPTKAKPTEPEPEPAPALDATTEPEAPEPEPEAKPTRVVEKRRVRASTADETPLDAVLAAPVPDGDDLPLSRTRTATKTAHAQQ